MADDFLRFRQEEEKGDEGRRFSREREQPKKNESNPPSSLSLKRIIVLVVIIVVFVGLNLGGYYLYRKGYLQIGADIVSDQETDTEKAEGYSEDINLLPTPN